MKKIAEILFVTSWLLCGCSIETIFDGGLPLFAASVAVVIITAKIISK